LSQVPIAFLVSFLLIAVPSFPQQSSQASTSSVSAASLLRSSLGAITGNTSVADVTLSGTARRIVGSDDQTGTALLQASSNGSAHLVLNLSSGTWTETANLYSAPSGSWSAPDSVSHAVAYHNLLAESTWFSPGIAIARRVSSTNYVATYIGHETLNGQAVEHISAWSTSSLPDPPGGPTFAHLSQVDFYFDSTTLLPAAINFNVHPDNNTLLDIPVQVLFFDYRSVSGVQVPFHIQKLINSSLVLEFQFSSVSFNSGLSASTFNTL